ncbi:hypothetical protein ACFVYE_31915 [Streptomyces sp. NPDC058239]|uniref:hypothetical protein n=1 Tax=Streptomyces sp. NPDC058239 TaxID=3346395 RepID=UPI0036EE757C
MKNISLSDAKQPTPDRTAARAAALQIADAVNEAYSQQATSVRVDDPEIPSWRDGSRIGPTPPVAQPGQPPMSQWAIDASGVLKAVGVVSLPVGGALWIVGQVDPMALGIICGTPVALALAVGRLVARIKATVEAAPAPVHHHYNGNVTVDKRSIHTQTRGVIANTRNQLPR